VIFFSPQAPIHVIERGGKCSIEQVKGKVSSHSSQQPGSLAASLGCPTIKGSIMTNQIEGMLGVYSEYFIVCGGREERMNRSFISVISFERFKMVLY
jgi:hypothetical protein